MAKQHNLKSGEEAAKNGRIGGIKSGEAKRLYKTFKEVTNEFLSEDKLKEMVKKLYTQVIEKGDAKAFEVLRDTKGEKPVEKAAVATGGTIEEALKRVEGNEY